MVVQLEANGDAEAIVAVDPGAACRQAAVLDNSQGRFSETLTFMGFGKNAAVLWAAAGSPDAFNHRNGLAGRQDRRIWRFDRNVLQTKAQQRGENRHSRLQ